MPPQIGNKLKNRKGNWNASKGLGLEGGLKGFLEAKYCYILKKRKEKGGEIIGPLMSSPGNHNAEAHANILAGTDSYKK